MDDPCPAEWRKGRHEVYLCSDGATVCRACGADGCWLGLQRLADPPASPGSDDSDGDMGHHEQHGGHGPLDLGAGQLRVKHARLAYVESILVDAVKGLAMLDGLVAEADARFHLTYAAADVNEALRELRGILGAE